MEFTVMKLKDIPFTILEKCKKEFYFLSTQK